MRRVAPAIAILDQLISALTSITIVVLVARQLPVDDFGTFALITSAAPIVVGVTRAYLAEPQLVSIPVTEQAGRLKALLFSLQVWLGAGLVALAPAGLVAGLWPAGGSKAVFGALAFVVGMGLLDALRTLLTGTGRAQISVLASSLLASSAGAFVLVVQPETLSDAILAVGLAYLGVGLGVVTCFTAVTRSAGDLCRPALLRNARPAIRAHGWNYAREFVVGTGGYYAATLAASGLVSLRAAAGIRGSESLLGPIRVVIATLPNAMMATSLAAYDRPRVAARVAVVLGLWAAACYGAALVIFDQAGRFLFGASAHFVGAVLPYLAIAPVFMAVSTGPILGLRRMSRSTTTLRVRTATAPLPLVGALGGSAFGIDGVAVGMAAASACAAGVWWYAFMAAQTLGSAHAGTDAGRDSGAFTSSTINRTTDNPPTRATNT
jgi:hypothetical protein